MAEAPMAAAPMAAPSLPGIMPLADKVITITCPDCGEELGTITIHDRGWLYGSKRYSLEGSGSFLGWLGSIFGWGEGYDTEEKALEAANNRANEAIKEHEKGCAGPIGDVLPLLLFALLFAAYVAWKKSSILQS